MISVDKEYKTKSGEQVILATTNASGNCPVLGWVDFSESGGGFVETKWTAEGVNSFTSWDLVEITDYSEFKIDDPVMVSSDGKTWLRRIFAGTCSAGMPRVWVHGTTSWTSQGQTTRFRYCRRPTEEDLTITNE